MDATIKIKDLPYKNKGDLTNGPVHKHLIKLTIPMIWGILAIISVQIVDVYYIAKLGTQELAAISFIFPVVLVITHLLFGLNIAISSVVSRLIGEKKQKDVQRVVQHGLFIAFLSSSIISALAYFSAEKIFTMLGASQELQSIIMMYMPIWFIAFIIMSVPVSGNSALRASGDAVRPAIVMMSLAFVNLVLDPILIFGLGGFPELGVRGAAVATLIAYIWGCGLGLYFITRRKDLICLNALNLDKFKNSLKRLAVIAVPAGITNIIIPMTNTIIVSVLALHGTQAVAAHGIANRVEALAMIAVISLAVGMTPIIGQNWGAKIYSRVHKTLNIAIGFNMIWSLSIALVLGLLGKNIAQAFSTDPEVVRYATLFFWIVPGSYAFGNLVMGWSSAFNAMGKPQRSLVMIFTHAAFLVTGVFIGNMLYGVIGIFIAISIVNVVIGILFHLISRRACLQQQHSKEQ